MNAFLHLNIHIIWLPKIGLANACEAMENIPQKSRELAKFAVWWLLFETLWINANQLKPSNILYKFHFIVYKTYYSTSVLNAFDK